MVAVGHTVGCSATFLVSVPWIPILSPAVMSAPEGQNHHCPQKPMVPTGFIQSLHVVDEKN